MTLGKKYLVPASWGLGAIPFFLDKPSLRYIQTSLQTWHYQQKGLNARLQIGSLKTIITRR